MSSILPFIITISISTLIALLLRRIDHEQLSLAKVKRLADKTHRDLNEIADQKVQMSKDATIQLEILIKKLSGLIRQADDRLEFIEKKNAELETRKDTLQEIENKVSSLAELAIKTNEQYEYLVGEQKQIQGVESSVTGLVHTQNNLIEQMTGLETMIQNHASERFKQFEKELDGKLFRIDKKVSQSEGRLIALVDAENVKLQQTIENVQNMVKGSEKELKVISGNESRRLKKDIELLKQDFIKAQNKMLGMTRENINRLNSVIAEIEQKHQEAKEQVLLSMRQDLAKQKEQYHEQILAFDDELKGTLHERHQELAISMQALEEQHQKAKDDILAEARTEIAELTEKAKYINTALVESEKMVSNAISIKFQEMNQQVNGIKEHLKEAEQRSLEHITGKVSAVTAKLKKVETKFDGRFSALDKKYQESVKSAESLLNEAIEKLINQAGEHFEVFNEKLHELHDRQEEYQEEQIAFVNNKVNVLKQETESISNDVQRGIEQARGKFDRELHTIEKLYKDTVAEGRRVKASLAVELRNDLNKILEVYNSKVLGLEQKFDKRLTAFNEQMKNIEALNRKEADALAHQAHKDIDSLAATVTTLRNTIESDVTAFSETINAVQEDTAQHMSRRIDDFNAQLKSLLALQKQETTANQTAVEKDIQELRAEIKTLSVSAHEVMKNVEQQLHESALRKFTELEKNLTSIEQKYSISRKTDIQAVRNEISTLNKQITHARSGFSETMAEVASEVDSKTRRQFELFNERLDAVAQNYTERHNEYIAQLDTVITQMAERTNKIEENIAAVEENSKENLNALLYANTKAFKDFADGYKKKQFDQVQKEINNFRKQMKTITSRYGAVESALLEKTNSKIEKLSDRIKGFEHDIDEREQLIIANIQAMENDITEKYSTLKVKGDEQIQSVRHMIHEQLTKGQKDIADSVQRDIKSIETKIGSFKNEYTQFEKDIEERKQHIVASMHDMENDITKKHTMLKVKGDEQIKSVRLMIQERLAKGQKYISDSVRRDIKSIETKINSFKKEYKQFEKLFNSNAKAKFKEFNAELDSYFKSVKSDVTKKERKIINAVQQDITGLAQQIRDLEVRLKEREERIIIKEKALSTEADRKLKVFAETLSKKAKTVEGELSEASNAMIERVQSRVDEVQDRANTIHEHILQREHDLISEAQEQINDLMQQIATLHSESNNLETRLGDEFKKQVGAFSQQLQDRLGDLSNIVAQKEQELTAMSENNMNRLSHRINELEKQIEHTGEEILTKEVTKINALNTRIEEIQNKIDGYLTETKLFEHAETLKNQLIGEVEQIHKSIHEMKKEKKLIKNFQTEISELRKLQTTVSKNIGHLKGEDRRINRIERQLNELEKTAVNSEKMLSHFEQGTGFVKEIESRLNNLDTVYQDLNVKIKSMKDDSIQIDALKKDLSDTVKQVEKLAHGSGSIDKKLNTITAKTNKIDSYLKDVENRSLELHRIDSRIEEVLNGFNEIDVLREDLDVRTKQLQKYRQWTQTTLKELNSGTKDAKEVLQKVLQAKELLDDFALPEAVSPEELQKYKVPAAVAATVRNGTESAQKTEGIVKMAQEGFSTQQIASIMNMDEENVQVIISTHERS